MAKFYIVVRNFVERLIRSPPRPRSVAIDLRRRASSVCLSVLGALTDGRASDPARREARRATVDGYRARLPPARLACASHDLGLTGRDEDGFLVAHRAGVRTAHMLLNRDR